MATYGTYGLGTPDRQPGGSSQSIMGLASGQEQSAMQMAGTAARSEEQRNEHNLDADQARKAGNSQLGSAVAGAAGGAAFGPWGALIGGALGAIAGSQT